MAKASTLTKHDYVTLRVDFGNNLKLNLTYSRSREKISGSVELGTTYRKSTEAILTSFGRYMNEVRNNETVGDGMAEIEKLAKKAKTIEAFSTSLSKLAGEDKWLGRA